MNRNSFTFKLTPDQQAVLKHILRNGNYRPQQVEHTVVAASTEGCRINLYKSGKCLVQGREASDFVQFVMEPLVLQAAALGYEDVLTPEASQPHIGVDESGKGDFFGPLVTAAAYIDESLAPTMRELGVKDSKNITSDKKALHIAHELRALLGKRFSIVKVGPQAYNRLYSKMRNVNTLLAWSHARAIENLLETVPDCPRAISDQFGRKEQVERALMQKGRRIELIQQHKAESDLAVAAASILARAEFVRTLQQYEKTYETAFPKGASAAVREAAVRLGEKLGPRILVETAKCHFRTTDQVLTALKSSREALGPEGQAVSKPYARPVRR